MVVVPSCLTLWHDTAFEAELGRRDMPFIQAGDITLYYELAGEGPRLLFLNGSNGDLRSMPNMFDGPLAKDFRLLGMINGG
jgi:3-oxoadipate enol-lactonase